MARVTRMIIVAMIPKYARCTKEWAQGCAKFTDAQPFTQGEGSHLRHVRAAFDSYSSQYLEWYASVNAREQV